MLVSEYRVGEHDMMAAHQHRRKSRYIDVLHMHVHAVKFGFLAYLLPMYILAPDPLLESRYRKGATRRAHLDGVVDGLEDSVAQSLSLPTLGLGTRKERDFAAD